MADQLSYLQYLPRNFANEYHVYVGTQDELDELVELLESVHDSERSNYHWLDQEDAIHFGEKLAYQYANTPNQWYGGWINGAWGGESTSERIEQAHQETVRTLEELRAMFV